MGSSENGNLLFCMFFYLNKMFEIIGPPSKKQKIGVLEECPHELKCYRRNPHHFMEYKHSHCT